MAVRLSRSYQELEAEIAERKKFEEALRRNQEELKTYPRKLEWSNHELQDFASVASHDLQSL